MDFIKIENLCFTYDDEEKLNKKFVLDNINLNIEKGEFISIIGHNGCGKSTLSKTLNALLTPTTGKVFINSIDTSIEDRQIDIRKQVGLVLQNPDNQLVASIVEEDVAFGPENLGVDPLEIRQRVDNALKAVDMFEYKDAVPHKLSGGQKQRVAIAGIIAMEPSCIVLDEPTAMLDPKGRQEVLDTVLKLNKEKGITIILITHNMDEAILGDRVVIMDSGKILLNDIPENIFSQVELLKKHRLDVPQSCELCYKLRGMGVNFEKLPLTVNDCVSKLEEVLK